jgi:heme-degrading monooxygenase HmoA
MNEPRELTRAPKQADEPAALIRAGDDGVTFIQIWEVEGPEAQQRWLAVMHKSIHILQRQPGFVSMTLHTSIEGKRIAVYAQWASRETLEAGISDPAAIAAHDRMAKIGSSDGRLYTVESVYGPSS